MAPLTSLIMTVYNTERYLPMAIESVLAQTRPEWELLVWDDGSTDGSMGLLESYAAKDERIRILGSGRLGRAGALIRTHDAASGAYVAWMDSDDMIEPTALAETARVLDEEPAVGMVYSDHVIMNERGRVLGVGKRCAIPYSKDRLLVDFMTFHFRLIRQSVYEQVGGLDDSVQFARDYDLCLKISEVTEVRRVRKSLYRYRARGSGISLSKRLDQIEHSRQAVEAALQRRGLTDRYELDVELQSKFTLRPKRKGDAPG